DPGWLGQVIPLLLVGMLLGPGYTVPPIRLVYRGFGEFAVSLVHSVYMILCGWVFQGGWIGDKIPWLLGAPMFFAILTSITLTAVPDRDADLAAGKKTLPVRLTNRGATGVTIGAAIAAWLATLFITREEPLAEAFRNLLVPIGI